MTHILITGGAGFIGSHVAEQFLHLGDEVTIIDDLSTGSLDNLSRLISYPHFTSRLHLVTNSILNRPIIDSLVRKADRVIHLAAAVGVKYVLENPLLTIEVNVRGTELLLELCSKYAKRVVISSSSEVYGRQGSKPLQESDNCLLGATSCPRWNYASTKLANEHAALSRFRESGLEVVIARLFNTSGARQSGSYGMVIPRLVIQALENIPLTVYGDGRQSRTFTDVTEVGKSIQLLMNCRAAIGEIVNIGGVEEISIIELAQRIIETTQSSSQIQLLPYSQVYSSDFEDIERRFPSTEKLKKLTGFAPVFGVDKIIADVIDYYQDHLSSRCCKQAANL